MFRAYGSFPNAENTMLRTPLDIQTWSSGPIAPPPTPTPSPSTTSSSPDFQVSQSTPSQLSLKNQHHRRTHPQQNQSQNIHLNGLQAHQIPIGTTLNNLINSANMNNNNSNTTNNNINMFKSNDIKGIIIFEFSLYRFCPKLCDESFSEAVGSFKDVKFFRCIVCEQNFD